MRNVLTWGSRPRVKSRGKHSRKAAGTTHGTHGYTCLQLGAFAVYVCDRLLCCKTMLLAHC